jgi:hypothetical protein
MIMEARHNLFVYSFFKCYTRWVIRINFKRVIISGTPHVKNLPVLLIANHVSWWDGFWAEYINRKVFRKKFYFMMLEEQLRKYPLFNYCGGFSVRKRSRSLIDTLNYSARLLSDPANMVLVFPQGKIESSHISDIRFEKGVEKILEKIGREKIMLVFLVNLTDFLSSPKLTLYQCLEEYEGNDFSCSSIEKAYNLFYRRCIDNLIYTSE